MTPRPLAKATIHVLSAPTVVNLEITEACNLKCRHCYNSWRAENASRVSLTKERLGELIEQFVDAGVFHVVLTGGEPMAKMDLLEYGLTRCADAGISVSCNSNLTLATPDKIKRLKDAGLDHILTSWCSSNRDEVAYIMGQAGAYEKVVGGIRTATENGIRVSVNTIVSQNNKKRVYDSGAFLRELGVTQYFAHRVVPPPYDRGDRDQQLFLTPEEALFTLDELLRLKRDTGMTVGVLISYPLCMLGDLEKYSDFVGRGCPSQAGHRFSISATGDAHCCVMEDRSYGNVFERGVRQAYANMISWHDGSYHYEGCEGCDYIGICECGCRMSALARTGRMNGRDPLMLGMENIVKPFRLAGDRQAIQKIEKGAMFRVRKGIRLRKEAGFHVLNVRWGNTVIIEDDVAGFLGRFRDSGEEFDIGNFGVGRARELANLLYKDAVVSDEFPVNGWRSTQGVSIDPSKLPTAYG